MFVLHEKSQQRLPIKVWLPDVSYVEDECFAQARNLSNLPFAFRHIALMPDTHTGFGMPIGGVLATKDMIIPNAVGVDIGCGMIFKSTTFPAELLRDVQTSSGTLGQAMTGAIMRRLPLGFEHRKKPVPVKERPLELVEALDDIERYPSQLKKLPQEVWTQLGTLGGGNHFCELQEDVSTGELCLMVHTGSRNFGYKIAQYFNNKAKELNAKVKSDVPSNWDLAYLPIHSDIGSQYVEFMNIALLFARENRQAIMDIVEDVVREMLTKYVPEVDYSIGDSISIHHNYAARENHFGEDVIMHRKGAIRMRKGELGIIPGAMGGYSYIVQGKGEPESFCSASHGAGRVMSRNEAKRVFSVEEMMEDFKKRGVILGTPNKNSVIDEFIQAYKDIDEVIGYQEDLIRVMRKVRTVCVVKG